MFRTPNRRIAAVAGFIFALDQLTKFLIKRSLVSDDDERVIIRGFFKLVHWNNTGAAWSMFMGKNALLAIIAIAALVILFLNRRHFEAHTLTGQIALGMIFGGIIGNLTDRLCFGHVTDFLYFYLQRRGGPDAYFPAFNIADSGICVGVALIFIMSLRNDARLRSNSVSSEAGS
jgi:signal peptidase II